ncbi:MAG: hypothetical protein JOZ25_03205 [Actinobacteria bacterium]|nr:hypothetical protein [Actinomycetota bacterium]
MALQDWRARAFGLEIDLSFEAPGLVPAVGEPVGRGTRIDLLSEEEIDRDWPGSGVERVLEERFEEDGPGAPARTIDRHPEAGYRLYARHFGLARISRRGDRVACAPPEMDAWSWQRFLVGRILPWTAVISGYEAFHSSAVELDGGAVAFVGASGFGKTSLALRLVAGGARFLTDDVLVIEKRDGALHGHPGAGIAAVRPDERGAIDAGVWDRLGTVLGVSGKTYLSLPRADGPLPLRAICFLWGGQGPLLERIEKPDPRMLLASTFVLGVTTPERLVNQLDVCAAIAREVPLFRVHARAAPDAGSLADAVAERLAGAGVTR